MQLPGKTILVLAAVCLSVIGGVGAYRVAQAARASLEVSNNNIIATSEAAPVSNSTNKLLSALQEAELETTKSGGLQNPFAPADDDTLTDRLSKNFFSSYVQAETGASTDNEALINSAMNAVDVNQLPKERYVASDLKVTGASSEAELKAYGNLFAAIQIEELTKIEQNQSVYKNDLNAIGAIYENMGERLMKVEVPVAVAAEHLVIANGFILNNENFKMISQQDKDPLKSLLGLRQYKETTERQTVMFTEIAAYLKSSGIIFNKSEPGYFWTKLTEGVNSN